jgi:PAT family beta-lactamase induction signal transducer AmpG
MCVCEVMNLALIKKIGIIFVFGFNSGLPIALTASILKALLHDYSIDLTTLGVFGLVTAPYSLKFLWSPLLDSVRLPFLSNLLGQRKSWILFSQIFLISSVVLLGQINPDQNIYLFAAIAFLLAFFSATQDISIDAYRIKILNSEEQGIGASSII